jgi:hypothetical protein
LASALDTTFVFCQLEGKLFDWTEELAGYTSTRIEKKVYFFLFQTNYAFNLKREKQTLRTGRIQA